MTTLKTRLDKLEYGKGYDLYIVSVCLFCGLKVLGRLDNIDETQCETHQIAPPLKKGDTRIVIESVRETIK